jgi:hypothetical protein
MTTLNKKNTRQLQSLRKKLKQAQELLNEANTVADYIESNSSHGRKTAKDPNAPKRPSTPWIFFYSDQVRPMKDKHPDKSTKEICALLGKKWGSMTSKQKSKYEKKAAEDRERYAKQKEEYEKNGAANTTVPKTNVTKKTTKTSVKSTPVVDDTTTTTTTTDLDDDLVLDDDDDFAADDLELSDDGEF